MTGKKRLPWRGATTALIASLGSFTTGWCLIDTNPPLGAGLGVAGLVVATGSAWWLTLLGEHVLEQRHHDR